MAMTIFVCESDDKADDAITVLKGNGYPGAGITKEKVNGLLYDAKQFDAGLIDPFLDKHWVVIGRK